MFKNFFEKFNLFTDCASRVSFWISIATSVISSGVFAYMTDFVLNIILYIVLAISSGVGTFIIISLIWKWLAPKPEGEIVLPQTRVLRKLPDGQILDEPASVTESQEAQNIQEPAVASPEYLSLQKAASILAEAKQFTSDDLLWVADFPGNDPLEEMFWNRDNPELTHKETLDKSVTIPLIHLCLHVCKKNNTPLYGKIPSFKGFREIPYKNIKYFDADYEKLYSDIARESTDLIYNDVRIVGDDLVSAIKNTDFDALIKEMNQH